MSGPSKSYLPSQRMMPTYTTVSPPREESKASTTSDYSYEASDGPKTTSPALPSPYSRIQESPKTVAELAYSRIQESPKTVAELAYSRIQEFPYGISGVPMPSYNYNSELYNYVSNGFPRKSRMCSYCGKVFTRSTTRRYHEKRCPLLRAAGSLMSSNTDQQQRTKPEPKPFTTNTSFPIAGVNSHSPFYGGFPASLYHATSSNSLDQNRNALNSIKLEPQERKEPQNGRTSRDASLDPPSTRMTPDGESRQMFTPTPTNNSPESMVSRGRNSSSPIGEDHDREKFRNSERSLDHKTDTSNSVFKYDEASHLQGRPYSHSGTGLHGADKDDQDGDRRDSILVDTGQNLFPSRDSAERSRSGLGNGGNEFSGITQGSNEDNELGEITSKNMTDKQCGLCGKVFDNVQELEAHEQLHTNHKPYACRFCGERFSKVSIRISHERIHMGEKPYVCAICGLSFTRKYSLRVHMRRKHVDGACLCRYCGKTTFDLQSLKDHLLTHDLPKAEKESLNYLNINGEKDDLPDEEDSNENSMSSDNNEEEFNGVPAATPEAGEVSTQSKDKEWCRLCEKDIPKSFLRYHERMHADQKPFECPLCKKRFGYKNNMKSHMKLHAGIKPYQCHICGAKFTRGSTLRRHARRHGIVTDTVWDFFTQKQGKMGAPREVSPSARSKQDENSADVTSTRPGPESAMVLPDSSHNYDLASLSASAANALYAGYSSLTSLPHGLYPPYSSTSLLQYATGYNPSSSALVQSDALNLSVSPAPHHHHLSSKIKLLDNTMDDMGPKSTMETDDVTPESPSEAKPGCRNIGIQAKTCCGADAKGILDSSYDLRMLSPSSFESSGSVATSPSLSSGTETLMNETLSSLLTSGKMFRCSHCYSFFAEYAMYRIHQKLHARDVAHPFMCPSCGEDCYDRMYFSLHLAEHLK